MAFLVLLTKANMGLLKTVFEVDLDVFIKSKVRPEKALLLFVIRDHIGAAPLQGLAASLQNDLERIWFSISKPIGYESSKIEDFFDLQFTSLPHKILLPENFEEGLKVLKDRFVDEKNVDHVFKPEYKKYPN